jgi:ribosomal protein S18 acetylase RimI-like enzyme
VVKLNLENGIIFKAASTDNDFAHGKKLFIEYANSLDFDLYFQGFSNELETLQSQYNSPTGSLIIAYTDDSAVGCIGLRQFSQDIAELKRMYVKPAFRGRKIGYTLLESILSVAKELGYKKIRLDSLSNMKEAILLYKSFGFIDIEPYRHNPLEGAIFMEKEL